MKRALITISLLMMLAFGLHALTPIQLSGRAQSTGLLTPSEIAAAWPNLPSAKELYDTDSLMIDLRYAGKQSTLANGLPGGLLPDPNSQTVYDMSSLIANYSSDDPIFDFGIIVQNNPHIWLQYNSTVWVEVPAKYLQTSVEPYATAVRQILNARKPDAIVSQAANASHWAVGEYDNPFDITNGARTMGIISYGEWTQPTLGSDPSYYTGVDVLSVLTISNYWLQDVMALTQSGMNLAINIWNGTDRSLTFAQTFTPWVSHGWTPSLNTMYNLYMTKIGSMWYFCWNNSLFYAYGDPKGLGPALVYDIGNQSNACVESNDFVQSDWTGFNTLIGNYTYSNGAYHCLPAIGFYFNNNWYPVNVGDPCPAAYEYNASHWVDGWFPWPLGTGNHQPPVWVGGTTYSIGEGTASNKEEFGVLYTCMQSFFSRQGKQLWSKGSWSPPS